MLGTQEVCRDFPVKTFTCKQGSYHPKRHQIEPLLYITLKGIRTLKKDTHPTHTYGIPSGG